MRGQGLCSVMDRQHESVGKDSVVTDAANLPGVHHHMKLRMESTSSGFSVAEGSHWEARNYTSTRD